MLHQAGGEGWMQAYALTLTEAPDSLCDWRTLCPKAALGGCVREALRLPQAVVNSHGISQRHLR